MNKKAIIFDLDGTLWEVTDITHNMANKIAKKHNCKSISKETVKSIFGLDKESVAKKYFPDLDTSVAVDFLSEIDLFVTNEIKENGGNIYKNLKQTLDLLKNDYELFIVSNTACRKYIESFIKTGNFQSYFKDYYAAGELNLTKSDAIKKLVKEYSLINPIYVGDTVGDKDSANDANVEFILAKYGFGKNVESKYSINSIEELPSKVKEINRRINKENAKIRRSNADSMEKIKENNIAYTREINILKNKLRQTNDLIQRGYSYNIIHRNYRGLIYVHSLYEYFETGRCWTLLGHEGAYNILEGDIKYNIIISNLDIIISKLEIIQGNQNQLYRSIVNANNNVNKLQNQVEKCISSSNETTENLQRIQYNTQLAAQNTEYLKWLETFSYLAHR